MSLYALCSRESAASGSKRTLGGRALADKSSGPLSTGARRPTIADQNAAGAWRLSRTVGCGGNSSYTSWFLGTEIPCASVPVSLAMLQAVPQQVVGQSGRWDASLATTRGFTAEPFRFFVPRGDTRRYPVEPFRYYKFRCQNPTGTGTVCNYAKAGKTVPMV